MLITCMFKPLLLSRVFPRISPWPGALMGVPVLTLSLVWEMRLQSDQGGWHDVGLNRVRLSSPCTPTQYSQIILSFIQQFCFTSFGFSYEISFVFEDKIISLASTSDYIPAAKGPWRIFLFNFLERHLIFLLLGSLWEFPPRIFSSLFQPSETPDIVVLIGWIMAKHTQNRA